MDQAEWQALVEEDVRDREHVIGEGLIAAEHGVQLETAADMSDGPPALTLGAPLAVKQGRFRLVTRTAS